MKAFPVVYMDYILSDENKGMDLRDYFAAKAMQALIDDIKAIYEENQMEKLVTLSYKTADAMMKAREL